MRPSPAVSTLLDRDDFPNAVTDTLAALSVSDPVGYEAAIRALLVDFESRDAFLEDTPVADTVLALNELAVPRELEVELTSSMLPS
jgi:hypothetical protein